MVKNDRGGCVKSMVVVMIRSDGGIVWSKVMVVIQVEVW